MNAIPSLVRRSRNFRLPSLAYLRSLPNEAARKVLLCLCRRGVCVRRLGRSLRLCPADGSHHLGRLARHRPAYAYQTGVTSSFGPFAGGVNAVVSKDPHQIANRGECVVCLSLHSSCWSSPPPPTQGFASVL